MYHMYVCFFLYFTFEVASFLVSNYRKLFYNFPSNCDAMIVKPQVECLAPIAPFYTNCADKTIVHLVSLGKSPPDY